MKSSEFSKSNPQDVAMVEQENLMLEKFNAAFEHEVKDFESAYLQSLEAYEIAMRNFILKNIAKGNDYEIRSREAWEIECDCLDKDAITELNVLERMIHDERWWLEEGQFDCPRVE